MQVPEVSDRGDVYARADPTMAGFPSPSSATARKYGCFVAAWLLPLQAMKTRGALFLSALSFFATSFPTHSQTTFATMTGTVVDASGAVVPKAVVTATQVETNYKYSATSNDSGTYTIPQLREGTYILDAKAAGFQDFHVEG